MTTPPDTLLRGRTCMVTGASSGIGHATAQGLAALGARVVMVCRDARRGERAAASVRSVTGNDAVEMMVAELSSMDAIRQLTADFLGRHDQLHVLVNNAGTMVPERRVTVDGHEMTFAVNHLAPFLLTSLLTDVLMASRPARVVTVASALHRRGRLDFDDLHGERRYSQRDAYCRSKLANVLFTYELSRRLAGSGVTANCLHPGVVATNLASNTIRATRVILTLARPLMLSPERGAATSIHLASAPSVEHITGSYFVKSMPARSSAASHDQETARRLWAASEAMTASSARGGADA